MVTSSQPFKPPQLARLQPTGSTMLQKMAVESGLITLRDATEADLPAIRSIYNHYVRASTATFDQCEQTEEERREWFERHQAAGLPVIVAVDDGQVVGWQSLSYYHSRCAYKNTVESSTYIAPSHLKLGLGRRLIEAAIEAGAKCGYHCIIGLICSENKESLALVEKVGFEKVGTLKEVGRKFNRWLDVTIVQLML